MLTIFFHVTLNDALNGVATTFSGISISGSGILLSMSFKNSTLAMSANLLLVVCVIFIVTLFIAICPPRSIRMLPSFCRVATDFLVLVLATKVGDILANFLEEMASI